MPQPDGHTLLASAGNDATVRLWNPITGEQISALLTGHTDGVNAVCPVPLTDGRTLLATGSDDRAVLVWTPEADPAVDDL